VPLSRHLITEINIVALPLLTTNKVIGFYKPINSQRIEKIMLTLRSKFGLLLYPIDQTPRVMNTFKNQDVWYVFIGDQSPLNMNNVYWNNFLGTKTPWLTGAEKLAKKYNYPVIYLHQIPDNQHLAYQLDISSITTNPQEEKEGAIIEKYSQILESEIKKNPSHWLWSHNRWKRANNVPTGDF
jgi:Kdo2-lipid IVA lauroyltransferase/acyltransferase